MSLTYDDLPTRVVTTRTAKHLCERSNTVAAVAVARAFGEGSVYRRRETVGLGPERFNTWEVPESDLLYLLKELRRLRGENRALKTQLRLRDPLVRKKQPSGFPKE